MEELTTESTQLIRHYSPDALSGVRNIPRVQPLFTTSSQSNTMERDKLRAEAGEGAMEEEAMEEVGR